MEEERMNAESVAGSSPAITSTVAESVAGSSHAIGQYYLDKVDDLHRRTYARTPKL